MKNVFLEATRGVLQMRVNESVSVNDPLRKQQSEERLINDNNNNEAEAGT